MYIVMGATGHIGQSVAEALLDAGQSVTALVHTNSHAKALRDRGAVIVEVDVHDVEGLRRAFRGGRRAFLLNPPADVALDTDAEEQETVHCILAALGDSGLERIVAESTYGARPGERCGDLSVLYGFEQGLRGQSISAAILRAAYYMSNWDTAVNEARKSGGLPTMFPADLKIPKIAPRDVGKVAAGLLQADDGADEPTYVEGLSAIRAPRSPKLSLGRWAITRN